MTEQQWFESLSAKYGSAVPYDELPSNFSLNRDMNLLWKGSLINVEFRVARCSREIESKAAEVLSKKHAGAALLRVDECVWEECFFGNPHPILGGGSLLPMMLPSKYAALSRNSSTVNNLLLTQMRILRYTIDGGTENVCAFARQLVKNPFPGMKVSFVPVSFADGGGWHEVPGLNGLKIVPIKDAPNVQVPVATEPLLLGDQALSGGAAQKLPVMQVPVVREMPVERKDMGDPVAKNVAENKWDNKEKGAQNLTGKASEKPQQPKGNTVVQKPVIAKSEHPVVSKAEVQKSPTVVPVSSVQQNIQKSVIKQSVQHTELKAEIRKDVHVAPVVPQAPQDCGGVFSALAAVGAAVWRGLCYVGNAFVGLIGGIARLKFW